MGYKIVRCNICAKLILRNGIGPHPINRQTFLCQRCFRQENDDEEAENSDGDDDGEEDDSDSDELEDED